MIPDKTIEKLHQDEFRDQISSASPTKVLNVSVPESVYWHIRRCASESRMSLKAFMAIFGRTATPIPVPDASSHTNTDYDPERIIVAEAAFKQPILSRPEMEVFILR